MTAGHARARRAPDPGICRLRLPSALPQTYGTQIADVIDGKPVPWPCSDPERFDELRARAGLEPFEVNAARYA